MVAKHISERDILKHPSTQPASEALSSRLARNLAQRRRMLGLTQAQLAEKLGVDTETLSRFERGKHVPSLMTLERLAVVLLTSVSELLAQEPAAANEDALAVNFWLAALTSEDRKFAIGLLKQCCDFLIARKPPTHDSQ